ncbi:hypothetical protein DH2020_027980 [Rehmannia glutinosa]|uniref:THUMP domain-containing protein n=1 Tax=Rehmannia glutinosa TaxID=99300 RepID=A0ABR0VWA3_REHGL
MSNCFLEALEYLDLSENQLSGGLTRQFGEFKSLRYLSLGENSLCGEIPKNLGNLSSLEYLSLGSNKLTGNLPESMGQIYNLKQLYVNDNMLEGIVTETHFAHLSNLTELLASGNNLTLKVIPNWIPPFKLQRLQLRSWNLGSDSRILSWLETQKKYIWELDLSSTGISGNVPSWLLNIRALNLSNNQLCGNIPVINNPQDGFQGGTQKVVCFSSNNFSGPLPIIGNTLTELDLSNNSFSGDIFHFLCDATKNKTNELRVLHLEGNHLSGELPEDCLMNWPSLIMLKLGNNNFSGKIPNSIGSLTYLQTLNLYGNKFSGHIPFSMQKCKELLKIDLSDNNLDGNIPTWMGTSLSKLLFVILRSNKLSGEITSTICQLNSIRILDLSDNNFFGTIPMCVNNFTSMKPQRKICLNLTNLVSKSASVTTKGSELHYDTILRLVTNIDLSKNNLSGDIPKEITSLVELRSLNLSGNHLTGLVPDSIGNMKQLESLDFSRNSLSSEIPSSFTIMSSLSYLNLSCNNLTGKIPESTQLLGFNESSFIGNHLCGRPLTNPSKPTPTKITGKERITFPTIILKSLWRADRYPTDNDEHTRESENKNVIATSGDASDKSGLETKDDLSLEKQTQEKEEKPENHDKQEAAVVEPPVKRQCMESPNCGNLSKKVEDKSVDKLIEAELAELGDRSKRRFCKLDTGCNGVVFIQMRKKDGDPSPKDIVQHMMTSLASTKKHVSRFLLRVLPVEASCYTSEEEIKRAIKPLIDKHFPMEIQVPRKFAVLYDARANTGADRRKVIDAVAKCVPSSHKVDLANPDINIVVQIVKTVCLIGVVEKYKELAKYNLRQLSSSSKQ